MRVTIDVDGSELEALVKLLNLMHYTRMFRRAKYELYKTGKGYHIIARDLPITFEQSLLLRMMVGDDETRIMLDEIHEGKPKQVLFTWKRTRGYRKPLNIMEFIFAGGNGRDERDIRYIGLRVGARRNRRRRAHEKAISLAEQYPQKTPDRAEGAGLRDHRARGREGDSAQGGEIEMTEPCPFCGKRIEPIRDGIFKRCPECGRRWYEGGGGRRNRRPSMPGAGAAAEREVVLVG